LRQSGIRKVCVGVFGFQRCTGIHDRAEGLVKDQRITGATNQEYSKAHVGRASTPVRRVALGSIPCGHSPGVDARGYTNISCLTKLLSSPATESAVKSPKRWCASSRLPV